MRGLKKSPRLAGSLSERELQREPRGGVTPALTHGAILSQGIISRPEPQRSQVLAGHWEHSRAGLSLHKVNSFLGQVLCIRAFGNLENHVLPLDFDLNKSCT